MSRDAPQGYAYHNTLEPDTELSTFQVVPSVPSVSGFSVLAKAFQAVQFEASQQPYSTDFTPDQIAEFFNPDDPKLVAEQEKELVAASRTGTPNYMHARVKVPNGWFVTGVGNTQPTQSEGFLTRLGALLMHKTKEAEAVDVSLAVRESLGDIALQRRGFGLGLFYSLLDGLDDETPIVAHVYPTSRTYSSLKITLEEKLQFEQVNEHQPGTPLLFGKGANRTRFNGPKSGELRQLLTDMGPWLPYRTPVEDLAA